MCSRLCREEPTGSRAGAARGIQEDGVGRQMLVQLCSNPSRTATVLEERLVLHAASACREEVHVLHWHLASQAGVKPVPGPSVLHPRPQPCRVDGSPSTPSINPRPSPYPQHPRRTHSQGSIAKLRAASLALPVLQGEPYHQPPICRRNCQRFLT